MAALFLLLPAVAHAQALPMGLRPIAPGVFVTTEDQHRAAVASWIALGATMVADALAAAHCADRVRCLAVAGIRTGATIGLSEAVKHWVPMERPCAPFSCGSDTPYSDWPSGHTALATQAIGAFDHGSRCGPARSRPRLAVSVSGAAITATLRRAAWRHDIPALLLGAGLGAGVDALTAKIAC